MTDWRDDPGLDSDDFPKRLDPSASPMFKTGGFREFAISELGPESAGKSTATLLRSLSAKAEQQGWSPNRGSYTDTCRLCGWEGQHATIGKLWHITLKGEFYEDAKRAGMRPNFKYSTEYDAWICLQCIRKNFQPTTKSDSVDRPPPRNYGNMPGERVD